MSKVCPNCNYPNPDNLDTCFKCGADISEATMRQDRVRANLERNRRREVQRATRENENRYTTNINLNTDSNLNYTINTINNCYKWLVSLMCGLIGLWVLGIANYIYKIRVLNSNILELKEIFDESQLVTKSSNIGTETVFQQIDVEICNTNTLLENMNNLLQYLSNDFRLYIDTITSYISIEEGLIGIFIALSVIFIAKALKSYLCYNVLNSKNKIENINNRINSIEDNVRYIKNYYSNYEENSLENLEINNSEIIEGNYPETVEDAK